MLFRRIFIGLLLFLVLVLLGLELNERFSSEDPYLALVQWKKDILREEGGVERRAQVLRDELAEQLQLPALKLVRISMYSYLYEEAFWAKFNPLVWRIAFHPKVQFLKPEQIDFLIIHELAHAVAVLRNEKMSYGSHPETKWLLEHSYLSHQVFHEAYADGFALIWLLKKNATDSFVWYQLARSFYLPELRSSVAHDTFFMKRLLLSQAVSLSQETRQEVWLERLSKLASEASALNIAHKGLERESTCAIGLRGIAKVVAHMGYTIPLLPSQMASSEPTQKGEEFYHAIAELQALRPRTPAMSPWQDSMNKSAPFIYSTLLGASQEDTGRTMAQSTLNLFMNEYAPVKPEDKKVAYWTTRMIAEYSVVWRKVLSHGLVAVSDLLDVPQSSACK